MNISELSDEELMQLYQKGSEEAFKLIYSRHSAKIYAFLQSRISPKERLHEIYQEVFVKIHKSKHLYNKSFPLLPWIFTVTRTVMLDELKKEKRHQNTDELTEGMLVQEGIILRERALPQLNLLNDMQKTAIQMRYMDEKTFEEIAQTLQTSNTNVRQIISRGLKRLKELINEGGKS